MTILVDEIVNYKGTAFDPKHLRYKEWCHMVSDLNADELHWFAKKIGLKRQWFQGDHYDLTPGKRTQAVAAGAVEVTAIELVKRNCLGTLKKMEAKMADMYALSVQQPWPWAMMHCGKNIENRMWIPPRWIMNKRIWIHASAKLNRDGVLCLTDMGFNVPANLPCGALVGTMRITGVTQDMKKAGRWYAGRPQFGLQLADVKELPEPIRCKGQLGFWKPPDRVAKSPQALLFSE